MTTYKEIFGKPIKVLTGDPAPTPITYTVTVANPGSGNVYYIDGVQTPTLELYEGNTYNFDYSAATGHPFRFATAADAAGSTEYTTGVSVDSNITTIVVASGAPNLFYYCTNHNGMGGRALTPASPSEYEGQIWYNETTGSFRSVVASSAFSSGATMGTGRYNFAGWAGSAPADTATCFGGMTAAPAISNLTEEFNGSGWAAGGNTNTSRRQGAGFGIQTAAVKTAGYDGSSPSNDNTSEEYNGTAWTTGNNVNPQRQGHAGAGTLTAGVIFGGTDGTLLNKTEEYDGTNFSNVNTMNTARTNLSGAGSQTTSIAFGGATPPVSNAAEVYDGTNWTTAANMNTARNGMGSFGDSNSAVGTGGTTGSNSTATETWDGTSWTTSPASLGTARVFYGDTGSGSSTAGIVAGGYTTATVGLTEEYNFTANTITAAAFSSGNTINTARRYMRGFGIKTAGVICGGYVTSPSAKTEEFNGTTYSESSDLGTGRYSLAACGIESAGLAFGGLNTTPSTRGETEEYNGSSWSEQNNLNTPRGELGGAGTQTAGLAFGGSTPPSVTGATEEYDGSSWTTNPNSLNTARKGEIGGAGTQTAAVAFSGATPPNTGATEEYDGSSWTASNAMLNARSQTTPSQNGTQSAVFSMGGSPTAGIGTFVENYDGTSWSTKPALSTGRRLAGGFATTTDAVIAGGYTTTNVNITEEFTGETTALNYKNISSS